MVMVFAKYPIEFSIPEPGSTVYDSGPLLKGSLVGELALTTVGFIPVSV
jgi:hypothetical protein